MQNSAFHGKASTSGMIEGMVNPFEDIMRCIRFSVKLPVGKAYSLLFFAKFLHYGITMLSKIYLD